MDRAMAGPLITGASLLGVPPVAGRAALPSEDRERSMAAIRGVTAISRPSSAEPSRRSAPSIRPAQPGRIDKIAGIRVKRIDLFRNIIIYFIIYYRIYGKL
jgi:hypothetical protein